MEIQVCSQPYVSSTTMELITLSSNLIVSTMQNKRMGTFLRKLMKHQKLGGGTNHDLAGINIQQRLTGNNGVGLHDHYGRAICKHAGDVGAMTNTIWTFLQTEDDDRVRRTEPSSEEHTTTVMNASTIGKQACSVGP